MANTLLKDLENNKQEVLNIEVSHHNGHYRLSVNKETLSQMNGYTMREYIPFASGNFVATLETGRKSAKKLANYNNKIVENMETLKQLWLDNKYQEMYNFMLK